MILRAVVRLQQGQPSCHVCTGGASIAPQVGANRWEYDHAKLEGSFRKLAVPEPSQYDEEAYTEALAESLEATKRFVMHTTWVSKLPLSFSKSCCDSG